MAIFGSAPWSPIMGGMRGIVPSNLDMMLSSMGYGQALTSGGGVGGATNGGSQNGPTGSEQNDSMFGGTIDQAMQSVFGTDLFNDPAFNAAFGPGRGPNKGTQPSVPGLPSAPTAPAAPSAPSDLGMTNPDDQNSAANQTAMNDINDKSANLDSKSMGSVSPEGVFGGMGSVAGVPGSEQNSPNAVAGMNEGMATGMAPGMTSGEHGLGGMGMGGGEGGGGGGVGQGAGSGPSGGDPGSSAGGVGGVGEGGMGMGGGQGEGGNGGWHTGSWGPINGPDPSRKGEDIPNQLLKEGEAVTSDKLTSDLGSTFFKTMEAAAKKGLSRAQIRALGRALLED